MRPTLALLTSLLLARLAIILNAAEGATPPPILATEELAFVREVASATLKNCEVALGAVAKGNTNTLGFRAITLGDIRRSGSKILP